MLVADFKNGSWSVPKIVPYQPLTLDPASKIFHYGQSIFEGMKAYKDENGEVVPLGMRAADWSFIKVVKLIENGKLAKI